MVMNPLANGGDLLISWNTVRSRRRTLPHKTI